MIRPSIEQERRALDKKTGCRVDSSLSAILFELENSCKSQEYGYLRPQLCGGVQLRVRQQKPWCAFPD